MALRLTRLILPLLLLGGLAAGARAADGGSVGRVTNVSNQAQIGSGLATVGTPVHMNDVLRTGAKARLEVTFRDNTTLTLCLQPCRGPGRGDVERNARSVSLCGRQVEGSASQEDHRQYAECGARGARHGILGRSHRRPLRRLAASGTSQSQQPCGRGPARSPTPLDAARRQ
jgi:hypothetical protein